MENELRRKRILRTGLRVSPTILAVLIVVVGLVVPRLFDVNEHHVLIWSGLLLLGFLQVILVILSDRQSQQAEPGPLNSDEFVILYAEALTKLMKFLPLLQAVDEQGNRVFDAPAWTSAIQETLQNICAIAEAYKGDIRRHTHSMNACWYAPVAADQATAEQKSSARPFMDPGRNAYRKSRKAPEFIHGDIRFHAIPMA